MVRRAILLAVAGVSLYLLAPSLLDIASTAPNLTRIEPLWFIPMLVFEALSLVCIAFVQRVCLGTRRIGSVLVSGLAGNAVAKVVPGGGAAGTAMQYSMLRDTGPRGQVATALTAANLLTFATLLALPVLILPIIFGGIPVNKGLSQAAVLGAIGFVVMMAVGALLLMRDAPLVAVGRAIQAIRNRLRRGQPPSADLPDRLLAERRTILRAVGEHWIEALAASIGRWLFDYAVLLTALAAIDASPRPSLVLLAYVGAQVLTNIPVTPGGFGFVEAGLTGMLALAGVGGAASALSTLAYRLVSFWIPLPVGWAAAYFHSRYRARRRARQEPDLEAEAAEAQLEFAAEQGRTEPTTDSGVTPTPATGRPGRGAGPDAGR